MLHIFSFNNNLHYVRALCCMDALICLLHHIFSTPSQLNIFNEEAHPSIFNGKVGAFSLQFCENKATIDCHAMAAL